MVKKIIACADIHIPNISGLDGLKDVLNNFFEQCRKIVSDTGEDSVRIVVGGDIFHNKLNIDNEAILFANWFFGELDKIAKTIVIAGNHDFLMNNANRVDSLTTLFDIANFKNVVYLDKELSYKSGTYVDDNIVWCLYSSFDGFNAPDIAAEKILYPEDKYSYVGVIHADINGAVSPTNYMTENGVEPTVFEGLDFCIAGHIHRFQEIKKNGVKTVYCSSLKQQNYGETVTEHGFVLWNIEDKDYPEYEFVEVENKNEGFFKFEISKKSDIEDDLEQFINY